MQARIVRTWKVFPITGVSMTTLSHRECPPPDHPEDKNVWSMFHHGTIGQKWPDAGRNYHLLRVRHLGGGQVVRRPVQHLRVGQLAPGGSAVEVGWSCGFDSRRPL
jgi:hypothetical protein